MTKKTTKRALIASVLSIVICVAMLVGTTFAWFTDSASTGVNTIQSGTLDVGLVDAEGNSLEGQTLEFIKAPGAEDEAILWEPGCTYNLPDVYIVNNGNLAIKYRVAVSGVTGDAKLLEAIDFTFGALDVDAEGHLAAGETTAAAITISGHMREDAGNEYQNLTLSGIGITVYAAQDTVEHDSIDNQYDADAEYGEMVDTAQGFTDAIAAGETAINLTDDIVLTAPLAINGDVTVNGNGNTIISDFPVNIGSTNDVTFKNIEFAEPDNAGDNASNVYANGAAGKVVFDGCSFVDSQWDCIQITPVDGAEIVITNCIFSNDNVEGERFIHIQNTTKVEGVLQPVDVDITITNNTFGSTAKLRNSAIDVDFIDYVNDLTVGGNTFAADIDIAGGDIYVCDLAGAAWDYNDAYAAFIG